MAHVTINRASKRTQICYVIIDFRNEKFRTHYCRKAEAGEPLFISNLLNPQKKLVVIKAKILTRGVSSKKTFFSLSFMSFATVIH